MDALWFTTAERQHGRISYEGRSETSRTWSGGAAYVVMCGGCGLQPESPGFASHCLCHCKRCFQPLSGKKVCPAPWCRFNGRDDGRPRSPEEVPIGTVHVKAKRIKAVSTAPACVVDCSRSGDGVPASAPVVVVHDVSSDEDDYPPRCMKPASISSDEDDSHPRCMKPASSASDACVAVGLDDLDALMPPCASTFRAVQ